MSNASYLLVVNLSVAMLLAAAFWLVSVTSDRPTSARWLAASYAIGSLYAVSEIVAPMVGDPRPVVATGFLCIVAATALLCVGLMIEFNRKPNWLMIVLAVVGGIVFYSATIGLPRSSAWRLYAYQAPLAALLVICLASIRRPALQQGVLQKLLLVVIGASAIHFMTKPLLAQMLGGTGAQVRNYINTPYAMASQALGIVLALGLALLSLAILVRGMLKSAAEKSEIDRLSNLLNRGGFDRLAKKTLDKARSTGWPVAVIVADIDHFKSINDRFGHAAGDEAIRVFASFLRTANPHQLVARTGGEEFAIIVVGADSGVAQKQAEALRNAFAASTIEPWGIKRPTASFGVAEYAPGETLSQLMRRADMALYAAKNAGRDRVVVAPSVQPAGADALSSSGRALATPVDRRNRDSSSAEK